MQAKSSRSRKKSRPGTVTIRTANDRLQLNLAATQPPPPTAFSVEARDQIIEAFERHHGKGRNYRSYAAFVKFLFWIGCRPCEAIGLRWGSVLPDCRKVHFHESIVEVSGKQVRRAETTTGVRHLIFDEGAMLA